MDTEAKKWKIWGWMATNYESHVDPQTNTVCMTTLAEDCANSLFDEAATDFEFEIAHEFAEANNLLD